jgi:hypothetical protein
MPPGGDAGQHGPSPHVANGTVRGLSGADFARERKLGTFGDCQRKGDLGALTTRQRACFLAWVEAKLLDPELGEITVPDRIEPGAHAEVLGDRQSCVSRRVLRDEAHPCELRRAVSDAGRSTLFRAALDFARSQGQTLRRK